MTDHRERFLEIEDQADKLVSQLQALKTKMEAHSSATQALEEVHSSLVNSIPEMATMTGEIKDLTLKLDSIGTPEILNSVNSLEEKIDMILPFVENGMSRLERLIRLVLVIQVVLTILAIINLLRIFL